MEDYEFDPEDTGDFCCYGCDYGICEECFELFAECRCYDD